MRRRAQKGFTRADARTRVAPFFEEVRSFAMKKFPSVLMSVLMILAAGCSSESELVAPPPNLTAPPPTPAPPLSNITVSLAVPAADVAKIVNEKTTGHVADVRDMPVKCAVGTCKLTLDANRTGPITVEARDNALKIDVPFAANAYFALPGLLSGVKTEAHVRGRAAIATNPSLGPNWQVLPHVEGKMEMQNSQIHVGPINTDLAAIWNGNSELLSRPLFRMIDKTIADGLHQGPQVTKIWNAAAAPIKINAAPAAWLVLQPERIRVGQMATWNNTLYINLGLDVRAQLAVQDAAPAVQPRPLPAPAPMNAAAGRFKVAVPVVLSFPVAARMALDNLTKNPPRVGSHTLKVTKLTIIPSGQDVVVQATFCVEHNWDAADALKGCGTGYLRGVPTYDATTQKIKIDDLHYDMQTEDFMMRVMNALAGPALGRELAKGFAFGIDKDIARIRQQLAAALAKPQGNQIQVSGKVEDFGQPTLTWTRDGFVATMPAEGSLKADLHL